MTRLPEVDPPARPRRLAVPGGWPVSAAFLAAVILCIGFSIAYYLNPSADHERVTSPGPPPLSGLSLPPSPSPAGPAAGTDVTAEFKEFAVIGRPFPPEWVIRIERVYWAKGGGLWADAAMPKNPRERDFTIEKICGSLSSYVTDVVRRGWPGVSVRDAAGAELITRARPSDSCEPAS
jgi:hypothetical protein